MTVDLVRPGLTDAEYVVARDRVRALVDEWKSKLWLTQWDTPTSYGDGVLTVNDVLCTDAAASCKARWEYQTASLQFNLRTLHGYKDPELAEVVIHELLHAAVNEMRDVACAEDAGIKHEERVVTHLTNVVMEIAGIDRATDEARGAPCFVF